MSKEKPILFSTPLVQAILEGRKKYKPKKLYVGHDENHLSDEHIKNRLLNGAIRHPESDCWFWIRHVNNYGYGKLTIDGGMEYAHRKSYELFVGEIPEDMNTCHKCDNPRCINPDHLFIGTRSDNMKDASEKGRINNPIVSFPGEENPMSKLSESDVQDIKKRCKGPETQQQIADDYGISQSQVSNINRGVQWNDQ